MDKNYEFTGETRKASGATQSTAVALPEDGKLATILKNEDSLKALLVRIEEQVRSEAAGLSPETKKGRDALKSLAHKVSKSKVAIDKRGLELTEAARKEIAAVNAGRNTAVERLDLLRDETKKPALDWESAEAARVEAIESRLYALTDTGRVDAHSDVHTIRSVIAETEATDTQDASWAEYQARAAEAKETALAKFRLDLKVAEQREAEQAELARLRAEAEERARKDAEEQATRERAKAEQRAAEEAEAARIAAEKAEAERAARIECEKREAAEQAVREAEARAKREAEEAAARHKRELEEAHRKAAAAAEAERQRIVAERKAEEDARAKREADAAHRAKIAGDIADALRTMAGAATPEAIADALIAGKIPHVKVTI